MSTQLRTLFEERSATAGVRVRHEARLFAVRQKIKRVRRRRLATAGAALTVVAVAAIAAVSVLGANAPQPAPRPADPNPSPTPTAAAAAFPAHYQGARVVASKVVELPDHKVTLTYTPTSLRFSVAVRCDPETIYAKLTLNGFPDLLGGSCSGFEGDPAFWTSAGVRVGEPVTFVLAGDSVIRRNARGISFDPLPAKGSLGLAVVVPVPVNQYLFPSPPATLAPLAGPPSGAKVAATVRNKPGDPLARRSVTIVWTGHLDFLAQMQTPGKLRVSLNGSKAFMTCTKWDYRPTGPKPNPDELNNNCYEERVDDRALGSPGSKITVTVIPEGVTGDWQVRITP
jgi:hypothetical protein